MKNRLKLKKETLKKISDTDLTEVVGGVLQSNTGILPNVATYSGGCNA